jgi:high-affinity nickel-transport protein
MNWGVEAALFACGVLGLRHGFDYDHLAALTDITAVQKSWREGMRLGLTYAVGHALTVVALGIVVILFRRSLPAGFDAWASRLTGATLVLLAIAVIGSLIRGRHSHTMIVSRWAILIDGFQQIRWHVQRRIDSGVARPQPFAWAYSKSSVFGIGVLHGLGAETPTQLMVFLLAASLGGPQKGFLGLLAFAIGLILMNAVMSAGLGGVFGAVKSRNGLRLWAAATGAAYSLAIGLVFLLNASGKLPPF